MLRILILTTTLFINLLFSLVVFADTTDTSTTDTQKDTDTSNQKAWACPAITELTLNDKRNWEDQPHWKSYDFSYDDKLSTFLGAQWAGTPIGKVGQVNCIYQGDSIIPISLIFSTLVLLPTDTFWKKQKSSSNNGGLLTLNCKASDVEQCEFFPRKQKEKKDPIEEALQLKK